MKLRARIGDRAWDLEVRTDEAGRTRVLLDGTEEPVDLARLWGDTWSVLIGGRSHVLTLRGEGDRWRVSGRGEVEVRISDPAAADTPARRAHRGAEHVTAVMPGRVVRVLVEPGQQVVQGQGLLVVEAMKMENEIGSPRPGAVSAVRVAPGQTVEAGAVLVEIA